MAGRYFRTEGLTVGYHGEPVLRDVTTEIKKGEIVTLIGPNGAGKSTLLKSIAGQLEILSGVVELEGQNLAQMDRRELSRRMAVVFTDRTYAEMMSCYDMAAGGRYPYTGRFGILTGRDRAVVEDAMRLTKVWDIRNRDYGRISDGQRQRVLLARALCQQPEIILLDEPVSYLDIRHKLEFLSVLQRLARERSVTVLMSLHELDLAKKVSDRIMCIGHGCAERFGTPEEIYRGGYLKRLFEIETGTFDEESGGVELAAPEGEPEVFVLAGGGSGRETYRRLQREGRPFATGVLSRHDPDYPVAAALAAAVVSVPGTAPMGAGELEEARRLIDRCGETIVCREDFAEWEETNRRLLQYIRRK